MGTGCKQWLHRDRQPAGARPPVFGGDVQGHAMAQIVLILEDVGPHKAEIIKRARTVVSMGISEITMAIETGEPVFVRPLFDRRDAGFPSRLLTFLNWLESHSLPYKVFEVLDHERYERSKCNEYYTIDAIRLKTMISTRESSLNEQRRLFRLQDGEEV